MAPVMGLDRPRLARHAGAFAWFGLVAVYVTWPLALDRSRIIVYTLLPEMYFDRPNFEEEVEVYREFQRQVVREDSEMLESMQNGLASKNFAPGRMAGIERGVHHVLTGYLDRMFPPADR